MEEGEQNPSLILLSTDFLSTSGIVGSRNNFSSDVEKLNIMGIKKHGDRCRFVILLAWHLSADRRSLGMERVCCLMGLSPEYTDPLFPAGRVSVPRFLPFCRSNEWHWRPKEDCGGGGGGKE